MRDLLKSKAAAVTACVAALMLAACGAPPAAPPAAPAPATSAPAVGAPGSAADPVGASAVTPGAVSASALPKACLATKAGPAATIDVYKRDLACHVYARTRQHLFEGAPPPLLKSVTVLALSVDAQGRPTSVTVRRTNGFRELDQRAIQSIRDAAPLPLPPSSTLRRGVAEFNETWLFRDDGRFQIRSLAEVQASE